MQTCCVCGKKLPNRFAVGGRCIHDDCNATFCKMHWNRGNHKCPEHGYREQKLTPKPTETNQQDKRETTSNEGVEMNQNKNMQTDEKIMPEESGQNEQRKVPKQKAKKAMTATLAVVRKLGGGASELWKRLRKTKTPDEMLEELNTGLESNRSRRKTVSARLESLHAEIATKKKEHAAAGRARQRVLEAELKSMLAEYKAVERELNVLLENERVISQVHGRMNEMMAYDLAGVNEEFIDDVALDIEDRAADADSRLDAARDLEKAGKRRASTDEDEQTLWDALDEFDDETEFANHDKDAADTRNVVEPDMAENDATAEENEKTPKRQPETEG